MTHISIMDVMVKDHNYLMRQLKDMESNMEGDFESLMDSFNAFQWNLEKHFFVEERAIFTWYNPEHVDEGYQFFMDISKQHTQILDMIEALRKRLYRQDKIDVDELKKLLVQHKSFEEEHVYPVLDKEISEGEKRFMIERIKEISLK